MELKETLSGSFGSVCCVMAGQPFDVVKLRLQTHVAESYARATGLASCFSSIIRREGCRALWKGATPALASAFVENSIVFTMNGVFKRVLAGSGHTKELTLVQNSCAAGLAGFFSSTAMCPAEVVKCRLQFAQSTSLKPLPILAEVLRTQGLQGLFQGWTALVCRDVPYNAVFFGSYEGLCRLICQWRDKVDDHGFAQKVQMNQLEILLAGGGAGAIGWTLVFPADVVKSRLQSGAFGASSMPPSFGRMLLKIFREEGLVAFRSGWGAAVLRAFPANAALFLGVESFSRACDSLEREQHLLGRRALPILNTRDL